MRADPAVADVLRDRGPALAEEATTRHFAAHPDLDGRWGPNGRTRCTEDGSRTIEYLATAVRTGRPDVFDSYIEWVQSLLAGLGIDDSDLRDHLATVREVIVENVPDAAEAVDAAIAAAGERLAGTAVVPTAFTEQGHDLDELARTFLGHIVDGERHDAATVILEAVEAGTPIADVYLQVFQPALREIGRLWQLNEISVGQEHLATAITQLVMAQLYPRIFDPARPRHATMVAACVGGELHEVGLRMVADIFELEGWNTHFVGANVPVASVVDLVRSTGAEVVAISATLSTHVEAAMAVIAGVREHTDARIMVGGRAFLLTPDLWQDVGADATASDALEAVAVANGLLGA